MSAVRIQVLVNFDYVCLELGLTSYIRFYADSKPTCLTFPKYSVSALGCMLFSYWWALTLKSRNTPPCLTFCAYGNCIFMIWLISNGAWELRTQTLTLVWPRTLSRKELARVACQAPSHTYHTYGSHLGHVCITPTHLEIISRLK